MADGPEIPIARPILGEAEREAVLAVLESGQLAQGERVRQFEEAFAGYIGVEHAIAVNSGTAALVVALQAHGVGAGHEVITSPFSFVATATAIIACGATPLFADIDDQDLNLDPEKVEAALTPRTRAILPVHLYGHPARIDELGALASDRELALIEDAAQAHGAALHDKRVGSFGTGTFSFYPTKNMTTGEGGMVTTDDGEVAELARAIRNQGQTERYHHELYGLNWRMTEIAAAIGLVQLGHLEEWNTVRRANAAALTRAIQALDLPPDVIRLPEAREDCEPVFHQYTIRMVEGRDQVREHLAEAGIATAVHYPTPIHRQPVILQRGFGDVSLPVAESAVDQVLSLPVYPGLEEGDIGRIASALESAVMAVLRER